MGAQLLALVAPVDRPGRGAGDAEMARAAARGGRHMDASAAELGHHSGGCALRNPDVGDVGGCVAHPHHPHVHFPALPPARCGALARGCMGRRHRAGEFGGALPGAHVHGVARLGIHLR